MKKLSFLIFVLFVALASCKQKPTTWDSQYKLPLLTADLKIDNLLSDTLLIKNADSTVTLNFKGPIYKLNFEELLKLPDTTIVNDFTNPFNNVNLNAGDQVINLTENLSFKVDEASIRFTEINQGFIDFKGENGINERITILYTIPDMKKNGVPFSVSITIPRKSGSSPGRLNRRFDISGYQIDFTNTAFPNSITYNMIVRIAQDAQPVTLNAGDFVKFNTTFSQVKPLYAKGYFGQKPVQNSTDTSVFDPFKNIINGNLHLNPISMKLSLENGIGMDARFRINKLYSIANSGQHIPLQHEIVGKRLNITRASDQFFSNRSVTPVIYEWNINENNSNFRAFIENLPNRLGFDTDLEINPLGNVSGNNDFLHYLYPFAVNLDINMPLAFGANRIVFADTTLLNIDDPDRLKDIQELIIDALAENNFPFALKLSIKMLDKDKKTTGHLLNQVTLAPGRGMPNEKLSATTSTSTQTLPKHEINNLIEAKYLAIKAEIDSPQPNTVYPIYSHYGLKLKLLGNLTYRFSD